MGLTQTEMINFTIFQKEKHSNTAKVSIKKKKKGNKANSVLSKPKRLKDKCKLHFEQADFLLMVTLDLRKKTYIWHLGYCDKETTQACLHCLYLCTW